MNNFASFFNRPILGALALIAVGCALSPRLGNANTYTWSTTGGATWANSSNWSSTVPLAGDVAQFAGTSYSASPSLNATASVGGILDTGAGAIAISGSAITIGASGIAMTPGAGSLTITAPVILGNAQTWTNNSIASLTESGNITGSVLLTTAGSGTVNLSGTNLGFTGGLTVTNGTVNISNNTAATSIGILTVGNVAGSGTTATLNVTSGNLTLPGGTSGASFISSGNGVRGVLNISGGNVTVATTSKFFTVGDSAGNNTTAGAGVVNQSAGTFNINLGLWGWDDTNGYSAYVLSGGSLNLGNSLFFGDIGTPQLLYSQSSGSASMVNNVYMGYETLSGAASIFDISGGTFTHKTAGNFMEPGAASGGAGTGGTAILTVRGTGYLQEQTGNFLVTGPNGAATGIVNLITGGTIQANEIQKSTNASAKSTINFDGGTLIAYSTNGGANFLTGLTNAFVYPGGLTVVNNNSSSITIGESLTAPAGYGIGLSGGSIAVASGGTGYLAPPTVSFAAPASGVAATGVAVINASGAVTGIIITSPGSGYTSGQSVAVTFNNGSNVSNAAVTAATPPAVTASTLNGSGGLNFTGTGAVILAGANTYGGATTISAGTLQIGAGGTVGSIASAITNESALFFNRSDSVIYANAISGTGALYQIGGGSLALAGTNTYNGNTFVNSGKLYLNGTNATPVITVATGATLGGSGSASSALVTVANNAGVEAGYSGTGSLTVAGLTFSNNGTINISNVGNYTSSAAIDVTGSNALITSGGANSLTIALGGAPPVGNGTAHLLQYAGGIQGAGFTSPTLNTAGISPALGARATLALTSTDAGYIDLKYTNDYPVWTGATDGTWVTAASTTSAVTTNWVLASSPSTSTNFVVNDTPLFNDTAGSASTTVNISAANVSPASVTFSNNVLSYTLTGAYGITGGASVSKSGTGTLTIANANSYTGGTTLSGGLLNINNSAALGAASSTLTITGGTIDNTSGGSLTMLNYPMNWNADFTFGGSNPLNLGSGNVAMSGSRTLYISGSTLTVGGAISGNGYGLTKNGAGMLVLAGSNSYSGPTVVNNGTLSVGNGGSGASIGSTSGVTLANNTSLLFNHADNTTFAGVISGSGGVVQAGGGALTLNGTTSYTGGTVISSGILVQASSAATGSATTGAITLGDANTGGNNVELQFNSSVQNSNRATSYKPINVTANGSGTDTLTFNQGQLFVDAALNISKAVTFRTTGGSLQYAMFGPITGNGAGAGNTSITFSAPSGTTLYYTAGYSGSGVLASNFLGNVVMTGSGTIITQNLTYISNTTPYTNGAIPNTASVTVNPGTTWALGFGAQSIDGLDGGGGTASNGGFSLTIGANNGSGTYSGAITGAGALVKNGTGTQILGSLSSVTGATSTFSGGITVNGGTLVAAAQSNGTTYTALGTAVNTRTITVNAGGTLQFDAPNVLGTGFNSATAPTLAINGGVVTNFDLLGSLSPSNSGTINNALNNVILGGGTLTATTGQNGGYAAWNINGTVTSSGNSLISTSDPVYGTTMLNSLAAMSYITPFNVTSGTLTVSAPLVQDNADNIVSGLNVTGTGTLLLTSSGNNYAGSTTITLGTLQLGDGTSGHDGTISNTNGVNNNSALVYNLYGNQTVGYAINGNGSVSKMGGGMLTLSNNSNGYSGGTYVGGGTLQLGNNNAIGSGGLTANAGVVDLNAYSPTVAGLSGVAGLITNSGTADSTLTVSSATATTFGGTIANGSTNKVALSLTGGTLALSGSNTFTGPTSVTSSKLLVNGSLAAGSVVTVNSGGTLGGSNGTINGPTGVLSGGALEAGQTPGSVLKFTGGLTLGTVNTDNVAINLGAATNYSSSAAINVTSPNGLIAVPDGSSGTTTINIGGSSLAGGTFKLIAYSGTMGGTGFNSFALGSTPTLGVRGTATLLNDPGEIDLSVNLGNIYWTGSASTAWTTNSVGTPYNWSFSNSGTEYLEGDRVIFNDSAASTTVDISDANVNPTSVEFDGTKSWTITSNASLGISGSTGLLMNSTGTLTLNNVNTYTGDTIISAGTIKIGNASALPSGFGYGNISINGTLDLNGNSVVVNALSGSGTVTTSVAGEVSFTLGTDSSGTPQNSTFSGVIRDGSGIIDVTKAGTGILTLAGSNTYSGATNISSGTLQIGVANALPHGAGKGDVTVSGVLDLNGINTTIDGLNGGGTVTNNSASTAVTLTVGDNNAYSAFGGNVQNGAGTVALWKTGSGNVTLTGANTYSGITTIGGGTLQLGNGGAGSSFGTGPIVDNAVLAYNESAIAVNSLISGSGAVVGTTPGALTISQSIALTNGSFTFNSAGATIATGVNLSVGSGTGNITSISTGSTGFVISGVTSLSAGGAGSINFIGQVSTSSGGASGLNLSSGVLTTAGNVNLSGMNNGEEWGVEIGSNTSITATSGTTTINGDTASGAISKSPFLFINNPTINLTASPGAAIVLQGGAASGTGLSVFNDYSVGTTFNISGSVSFLAATSDTTSSMWGQNGSFANGGGAPNFSVANGSTLLLNGGVTNMTTGLKISSSGSSLVIIAGSGSGTMSGAMTINGSSLTYNIGSPGVVTQSGLISGSGSVVTNGTGTVILSQANSYAGGTTVRGGTLQLGNGGALGVGGLTANAGVVDLAGFSPSMTRLSGLNGIITNNGLSSAVLTLAQSGVTTYSGSIVNGAASVELVMSGSGQLTLSGSNGYSGGTTVTSGALILDGAASLLAGSSLTIGSGAGPGAVFAPPASSPTISPNLAPVPEPGTLALFAVCAAAIVVGFWRHRYEQTNV